MSVCVFSPSFTDSIATVELLEYDIINDGGYVHLDLIVSAVYYKMCIHVCTQKRQAQRKNSRTLCVHRGFAQNVNNVDCHNDKRVAMGL